MTPHKFLYQDIESYSPIPIKNGSYAYAEEAEVMLWSYAFDDEPVKLWDRTLDPDMPADLKAGLEDPEIISVFHNGGNFDRVVIEKDMGVIIPPERMHDTMAQAFSHGFPGKLDKLCDIMKPPISKAKDKNGSKYIQLFCKPRGKKKDQRATRLTHPLEWDRFCNYAKLDIEAMRFIHKTLPKWNYTGAEYDLWVLDQKINQRGINIDLDLIHAAIRAVKRAQVKLAARTDDITLGDVASTTQRDELLRHILQMYGVDLPDMQASTLERRMEDENLPPEVHELLSIRLQASSTSTAKYGAFLKSVSADGRLRGTLQFSGAQRSKRWAGRLVQLQNLFRSILSVFEVNFGIEAMKADCEDLFFDNVMTLASSSIRGCIIPSKGKKLVISDLANIEGRMAAWIAGEDWKIKAYRDFDEGNGPDLYKLSYAEAFNMALEDITKDMRTVGKVMELMLQYQGGCGAFITGAATYGVDLDDMTRRTLPQIPRDVLEEATGMWDWAVEQKRTLDLKKEVFIACDSLKRLWRRRHPRIESMWGDLEDNVRAAIETKNKEFVCRRLKIIRKGNWLRIELPSGYYLCYPSPRVSNKGEISFMGMNQYTRKWQRINTYGGKIFENAAGQAPARDCMAWRMQAVEDAGYQILTHTHDELITEAPDTDEYSAKGLSKILATNPAWAVGLPLAAAGFEAYRYRKE